MTDTTTRGAARARGGWIGLAAGVLLGLVLLYSSWGKALDPRGVGEIYARKGLLPAGLATLVVVVAVGVEAAIGLALLVNYRRPSLLVLATALMLAFFGLTVYEYIHPAKDASSCGCFGNLVVQTPRQAVVRDGVFLLLALLAWAGRGAARRVGLLWILPVTGFVLAAGLAVAAPRLPVDDLATQLKPGAKVAKLRIDELLPELQRGKSFVLLLDRGDEHTRKEIARVNEHLALKPGVRLNVLGLAEENDALASEFTWTAAPAFEVRSGPFGTLKPLYRTLPRCFAVQDGTVVKVWNTIPDDTALDALADGRIP